MVDKKLQRYPDIQTKSKGMPSMSFQEANCAMVKGAVDSSMTCNTRSQPLWLRLRWSLMPSDHSAYPSVLPPKGLRDSGVLDLMCQVFSWKGSVGIRPAAELNDGEDGFLLNGLER